MYGLIAEGHFDAAHFLNGYQGKCENLHGHRWRLAAWIEKDQLQDTGDEADMVTDFSTFKMAVHDLCDEFDHMFIVEDGSLQDSTLEALYAEEFKIKLVPWRTTSENFARYFYDKLTEAGFPVTKVEVDETPHNRAYYYPTQR